MKLVSIVIAYANQNRTIVKCDGRECDTNTNRIVCEDTIKIKSIGNNCLIGYTGVKQYCEKVVEIFNVSLNKQDPFVNIKIFQALLQRSYKNRKYRAYFIITGNYNGKIVLWYLSWENGFASIDDNSPTSEYPEKYVVIGSKEIETAVPFDNFFNSSLTIEANMNNYIRYIATLSHEVNDHIKTMKIKIGEK